MSQFKSDFLNILSERGFIHQISDPEGLDAQAKAGTITGYIGFDATATSLHAGSLVQIMMLRWMQKTGHKPIALMGGGTTKIGDPSFKDESRKLLTVEQIAHNLAGIKQVFTKFLSFGDGPTDARMANNADWLDHLNYIDFLRDYGVHFTINRMLSFDSVKLRLDREQPLTFLEFNYMILQAYDFLELSRRHGCVLQMGGSDQWGNIVNGIDLTRRIVDKQVFGVTTPLITTASGGKMGKTADGAVWLNPEMRSPFDYWQFWRNTEDADVARFMRLFTDLPESEISEHAKAEGAAINDAKNRLADVATGMLHGEEEAKKAAAAAEAVFKGGGSSEGMPTFEVERAKLAAGYAITDALVAAALVDSKGDARRQIAGNAVKLNGESVTDEKLLMTEAVLDADGTARLSVGKKRHARLKAV